MSVLELKTLGPWEQGDLPTAIEAGVSLPDVGWDASYSTGVNRDKKIRRLYFEDQVPWHHVAGEE